MIEPFVLFQVAGATYGVRSSYIQQVEMAGAITRVPNAPAFVEGVASIRGQVIPVISLRRRFHMETTASSLQSRLIVFRLGDRVVAMLVDSAREFAQIDTDQITGPPGDLSGPGVAYLEGIVHHKNRVVLLVNLARLIDPDEETALRQSSTEPLSPQDAAQKG